MLEQTGEDPARLDRPSALAAEMKGYQPLRDKQALSQGTTNCRAYYSIVLIAQLAVQVHAIALALTWQLACN